MIADIEAIKKRSPVVTELFMRARKLKFFSLVPKVPKDIRLKTTYYFIKK